MKKCPYCAEEIQDQAIKCKHCGEFLEQSQTGTSPASPVSSMVSSEVKPSVSSEFKFPIVIHSSHRALWGMYFFKVIFFLVLMGVTLYFHVQRGIDGLVVFFWVIVFFATLILGLSVVFSFLRIKNTTYHIYENKIEGYSYLFKWLGVSNNSVNLKQLRQIKGFSNGFLDVIFFNCGKVILTVSGDISDFKMVNLYSPNRTKVLIEKIVFGSSSSGPSGALESA